MYAIAENLDGIAYWVTRAGSTDNYTYDKEDATRFPDRASAAALIRALDLDSDHYIVEV